jgi:hypothetical protein
VPLPSPFPSVSAHSGGAWLAVADRGDGGGAVRRPRVSVAQRGAADGVPVRGSKGVLLRLRRCG